MDQKIEFEMNGGLIWEFIGRIPSSIQIYIQGVIGIIDRGV